MKSLGVSFVIFFILTSSVSIAQKLKKADKLIVSNLRSHVNFLASANNEQLSSEYISKQFQRLGLKPKGDTNSWYQQFEIYDGKEVQKSNYFNINNQELTLYKDYFPFAFSPNKKVEGSVAIALAEDGYPWFKDINDLLGDEMISGGDISESIRNKAKFAADKGATALIIYNTVNSDLLYDGLDSSEPIKIPVIFLTKNAFKKYCADESATMDVKLNVSLKENIRFSHNIIGFANNGADSTVLTAATMDNRDNVAALIELARLAKTIHPKKKNYLFVAWSPEKKGVNGLEHFKKHTLPDLQKVSYTLSLDSVSGVMENYSGLTLVKQSIDAIKTNSR
jgi:aminopeptidase YwaD